MYQPLGYTEFDLASRLRRPKPAIFPICNQESPIIMKAYFIDRYGKNNGRIGQVPEPEVGADDVLVQVHATSVNLLDSKIRTGEFKLILPYAFPLVLGNDLAGVVVRVGSAVRQFKESDEVYARPPQERIGTFAERIALNQDSLALKPNNISMEEAASIPLVALTAWQVLVETARRCLSTLVQAASAPSPSNLPSTLEPSSRPPPAQPMSSG